MEYLIPVSIILGFYFGRIVYKRFYDSSDPVNDCELYQDRGCSHVDGYLCDMDNCPMLADYRLSRSYEK